MKLAQLRQQLLDGKQRVLLHLQGSQSWCYSWLSSELQDLADAEVLWFGETQGVELKQSLEARLKQYKKHLGQEKDLVIFDCYSGFNPDAFGALAGVVKLGGICILITPERKQWLNYPDPELTRLCTEPYEIKDIQQTYIARLSRFLSDSKQIVSVTEKNFSGPELKPHPIVDLIYEQSHTLNLLSTLLIDDSCDDQAVIIQADRGRGKSSLLGLLSANLLIAPKFKKLLVTAPLADSVGTLFEHCQRALSASNINFSYSNNEITFAGGIVSFVAPDHLMLALPEADLVLIDEAAAIPAQMLKPVIDHYPKAVFATTVHGYEGTGRGFEYKLKPMLKARYQDITELPLSQPIRWYADDLLEKSVNKLLALDAKLNSVQKLDIKNICFKQWTPTELLQNENKLSEIFALLVNAHYRTSPTDLRQMLDGPNIFVFTLESEEQTVAAAVIAKEGLLPETLTEQIWQGRRRPRGHLLPQSLIAHAGFKEAGRYSYSRVIRIATNPELQRRGVASRLLLELEDWSRINSIDFLCTSYGYDIALYKFWLQSGMLPARLGLKAEASTGEFSILMLKPLSQRARELSEQVSARFEQTLAVETLFNLRSLLLDSVNQIKYELEQQDLLDLHAFAYHFRGINTCLLAMCRFVYTTKGQISLPELVLAKCSAKYTDKQLINKYKFSGEKAFVKKLRELWQQLLQQHAAIEMNTQSSSK